MTKHLRPESVKNFSVIPIKKHLINLKSFNCKIGLTKNEPEKCKKRAIT